VIALPAQIAQADAVKTPIAPIFAPHSVHEPVHESRRPRANVGYVTSSSAVADQTSSSSANRAGGGFGKLIPGIELALATKPPSMALGHHEH